MVLEGLCLKVPVYELSYIAFYKAEHGFTYAWGPYGGEAWQTRSTTITDVF